MNKERRKEIDKAIACLQDALSIIESVAGEERDAYDNLPEGLQQAEQGERMDEAATALEDAASELDNMIESLQSAAE